MNTLKYRLCTSPQYGVQITASAFDSQQELFWTGSDDGRVSAYYGASLSKYISFKVPTYSEPDVKMIHPHRDNNIFVLTSECFSCYSRHGSNVFKHKEVRSTYTLQYLVVHYNIFVLVGVLSKSAMHEFQPAGEILSWWFL